MYNKEMLGKQRGFKGAKSLRDLTDEEKKELTKIVRFYEVKKRTEKNSFFGIWRKIAKVYDLNENSISGLTLSHKKQQIDANQVRKAKQERERKWSDLSLTEKELLKQTIEYIESSEKRERGDFKKLADVFGVSPSVVIQRRPQHLERIKKRTCKNLKERYSTDFEFREYKKRYAREYYLKQKNNREAKK